MKITLGGLAFILDTTRPVCSLDFVGYLFPINRNYGVNGMLDLQGNLKLFSDSAESDLVN